jgi:hypothetical protein
MTRGTNADLLHGARSVQARTTEQLQEGLRAVEAARAQAASTAAQLHDDAARIRAIDARLDDVGNDLTLTQRWITRAAKRLYTDRCIQACVVLFLLALVAVVLAELWRAGTI